MQAEVNKLISKTPRRSAGARKTVNGACQYRYAPFLIAMEHTAIRQAVCLYAIFVSFGVFALLARNLL